MTVVVFGVGFVLSFMGVMSILSEKYESGELDTRISVGSGFVLEVTRLSSIQVL